MIKIDFCIKLTLIYALRCRYGKYKKSRFIITSRPFGYKTNPLKYVDTLLEVKPFNIEQIKCFVSNWYIYKKKKEISPQKLDKGYKTTANIQSDEFFEKISINNALNNMITNPLLLTMITFLHYYKGIFPKNLFELYEDICKLLLGRRQEAKEVKILLDMERNFIILRDFALNLTIKNQKVFDFNYFNEIINKNLKNLVGDKINTKQLLDYYINDCGIIVEKEYNEFEFAHLSFQ
ncbi:MAG: hypothetical protein A2086_01220 [Spirochaetes bacterium GWD1_27_9]|nr:MAG: hypothetical protein A2Z98_00940 [Spirochaetes bacterium GWB1_27_13]OHD24054.1 MAG: hypothetical protein A2Y34_01140 [Spirochaetes bacterium GWC1_27_15]OHD42170.1 MAG: hypothetical protein A2086_01220 [Spirochaetes bacterium GWD1_27_9]